MLLTNQHLDKLAAATIDFEKRGMLKASPASSHFQYLRTIFPSHSVSLLIKFIGDQGVDSISILQDPDLDVDDGDTSIVGERLGMVHSAVKLASISGMLLTSQSVVLY